MSLGASQRRSEPSVVGCWAQDRHRESTGGGAPGAAGGTRPHRGQVPGGPGVSAQLSGGGGGGAGISVLPAHDICRLVTQMLFSVYLTSFLSFTFSSFSFLHPPTR